MACAPRLLSETKMFWFWFFNDREMYPWISKKQTTRILYIWELKTLIKNHESTKNNHNGNEEIVCVCVCLYLGVASCKYWKI